MMKILIHELQNTSFEEGIVFSSSGNIIRFIMALITLDQHLKPSLFQFSSTRCLIQGRNNKLDIVYN